MPYSPVADGGAVFSIFPAVVTRGQWRVDRCHCAPGNVVVLSAEADAEDTIKPRMRAAGADLSRIFVLDAVRDLDQECKAVARSFNLRTDQQASWRCRARTAPWSMRRCVARISLLESPQLVGIEQQSQMALAGIRLGQPHDQRGFDRLPPRDQHLVEAGLAGRIRLRHHRGVAAHAGRRLPLAIVAGDAREEQIAALFSLHSRTLNRRLIVEGTSFRALAAECRYDVARQLLETSDVNMVEIADVLGYAEASIFTRAFRRWSGTTPARWREEHRPACSVSPSSVRPPGQHAERASPVSRRRGGQRRR